MSLRQLTSIPYIPMLGLRPAEMQALEELPSADKQSMMPLIKIGPWASANYLRSAISRLDDAYPDRPMFISIDDADVSEGTRPVHAEIQSLRAPSDGYSAWCEFIEGNNRFVPALQLADPRQLVLQAARLHRLGRGMIVILERGQFSGAARVSQAVADVTDGGSGVCFMLDFGKGNRDLLSTALTFQAHVSEILRRAPEAFASICASSFPDAFTSVARQEIFERSLFNIVRDAVGERLIYSDRGSARAERQSGGGGVPAPRVDYATSMQWLFFRSDDDSNRLAAYALQAQNAMASSEWDGNLRVWGTQMIERTALGDMSAIISPKRCTAVRINIHLHRQTFYDNPSGLYDTDDDWAD